METEGDALQVDFQYEGNLSLAWIKKGFRMGVWGGRNTVFFVTPVS